MRHISRLDGAPFVMLAMNTGNPESEANTLRAMGLGDFVWCKGVYNGVSEDSFAVFFNSLEQRLAIQSMARRHNQESILVVDSNRDAELVFFDGTPRIKLGHFRAVPKSVAIENGSYTYVPNMDTYFVAK